MTVSRSPSKLIPLTPTLKSLKQKQWSPTSSTTSASTAEVVTPSSGAVDDLQPKKPMAATLSKNKNEGKPTSGSLDSPKKVGRMNLIRRTLLSSRLGTGNSPINCQGSKQQPDPPTDHTAAVDDNRSNSPATTISSITSDVSSRIPADGQQIASGEVATISMPSTSSSVMAIKNCDSSTTLTTTASEAGTKRSKLPIRVTVSPDEETESVQVVLVEESSSESNIVDCDTTNNCQIYSNHKCTVTSAAGESRGGLSEIKTDSIHSKGEGHSPRQENGKENKRSDRQHNIEGLETNRFNALAYFGSSRCRFAQEATLRLHNGPESTAPSSYPSWTPAPGTEFKVRKGPDYAKHRLKGASLPSLYEVYCVRFFRSGKRTVEGASRIMPLPESGGDGVLEGKANGGYQELKGTKVPDCLVVHFMLPYEQPSLLKQKDDGPGAECVYYLRPSQRFLDEISGRISITPASQLFMKWCHECESNPDMRKRFKCMALVKDIDKHNFGMLKSYNGKPVLITESGRARSGSFGNTSYLEMAANVHHWNFVAKKGFVSILPKFKNMQMEVGFTIEAHDESEMPECILGSTILSFIDEGAGPMITPVLQKPAHD